MIAMQILNALCSFVDPYDVPVCLSIVFFVRIQCPGSSDLTISNYVWKVKYITSSFWLWIKV